MKITDFGISKRWVGTSLKTQCGTAIYRSPEQLGILPRQFQAGNSYTNNIDIWALGVIVHEMLTLRIPFLDTFANTDSGFTSCLSTVEDMVDTGLLYGYCHGANPFPCGSLRTHGVPEDGIEFVKNLMAVNPSERLSAPAALASEWLVSKDPMYGSAPSEPVLLGLPPFVGSLGLPRLSPPAGTPVSDTADEQGGSGELVIIRYGDSAVIPSSVDLPDLDGSREKSARSSGAERATKPLQGVPCRNGPSGQHERKPSIKWVQIPNPRRELNHRGWYDPAMAKRNSVLPPPDFRNHPSRGVSPGRSPQPGDFMNPRPAPLKPSTDRPSPHARGASPERPVRWGGLWNNFGK